MLSCSIESTEPTMINHVLLQEEETNSKELAAVRLMNRRIPPSLPDGGDSNQGGAYHETLDALKTMQQRQQTSSSLAPGPAGANKQLPMMTAGSPRHLYNEDKQLQLQVCCFFYIALSNDLLINLYKGI